MAKSTKLINKTATFSWLVAVLGSMGVFLFAPLPTLADGCPAGQTCKHPCVIGQENDTGNICNDQGWTCCEPIPETILTPNDTPKHTQAECQAQNGHCVPMGSPCGANEGNVGNCDDISTADKPMMCCASVSSQTSASGTTAGSPMTLTNPLCPPENPNCVTLNALIGRFVAAFIGMVGALALLVFVYAGIMYMTAGSSDRVKQARDTMKYAVIGLALIIFAYALTNFFFNALSSSPPSATPPKKATTLPKS